MPIKSPARVAGAVLTLALLGLPQAAAAKPKPVPPASAASTTFGADMMPGEVIVAFKPGADNARRAEARRQENATLKRALLLEDHEVVRVNPGSERAAAASFARRADVAYAEPNAILRTQATPNDTRFSELWGLHNAGQVVNGFAGTVDADIDATEGWNIGKGLGATVRVADIDTGVAANHTDLAANMFFNPGESGAGKETNGLDDDANGKIDDYRGWDFVNNDNNPADDVDHGTHVAGTIAGRANNAIGVAGVASFPSAAGQWLGPKILAIKVLDAAGSGSIAAIADGFVYAGAMGAKVANVSLGGPGTSATLDNAIRSKPNTLYVIAAGNGGADGVGDNNDTTPSTPCNAATAPDAPNKICVAASDPTDALTAFSNYGAANVDLAAPGLSILSSIPLKTVFSDKFATPIAGRWTTTDAGQLGTPRWGLTTLFSTSAPSSLTDSPGGTASAPALYVPDQDNWARNTTAFNLAGGSNCSVTHLAKIDTEAWYDWFTLEATRTPTVASSWEDFFAYSGSAVGRVTALLPAAFNGQSGVFIRVRQTSDGSIQRDGTYVDDVEVKCLPATAAPDSFGLMNGTSMAAPHVTGAAAFLYTRFPTATVAQVKDKLLRSVDRKASLTGKVLSGGRLNLYKAAAESTASVASGVLRVTAGPGQTNTVTVTRFTDTDGVLKYRVTDPYSSSATAIQSGSRIVPGAGCAAVNDNTVKCPVAGITRISLSGGDLNDTLNASTIAIPVTIDGGAGLDTLTGGTAGDVLIGGLDADRFTAGAGNDTINSRNEDVDTLFSCGESTGDNDTVNADLAPDDPIAASPTNCEVVNKL